MSTSSKAKRKAGAKKAAELRSQFQRFAKDARHFVVSAALAAENTPESRKAKRALANIHMGNKLAKPGLYWQPSGALTARG